MPKLALHHINQTYREEGRKLVALEDVNLAVEAGEFVTIIGPSGCGKSTLLQVIAGLQQADQGEVMMDGAVVNKRLGRVAYMPQDDALLPWRTVLENAILGAEIQGTGRRAAQARARELLPLFGLAGFADALPAQLSGGMRQRVAFMRTFLSGKDIILLDEPFGALDALTRRDLHEWLLGVWEHFHYTILFVTHDVEEAIYLGDRVVVMSPRPGTIRQVVDVPFARPRTINRFDAAMVALEAQLFEALRGNVVK